MVSTFTGTFGSGFLAFCSINGHTIAFFWSFADIVHKWYYLQYKFQILRFRQQWKHFTSCKSKSNDTVQNQRQLHQNSSYSPRITYILRFEFSHISYIFPGELLFNKIIVAVQCPERVNILLMHFLNFPCVYIKYDNVEELAIFQNAMKMGATLAGFSTPWKKGLCLVYLCITSIWQRAWHSAAAQN